MIFVSGYWCQLTLYWILGTFSNKTDDASRAGGVFRAFEVAGQAVSYGLSSMKTINPAIPLYVNAAILILVLPSMVLLINKVPKEALPIAPIENISEDEYDTEKGR